MDEFEKVLERLKEELGEDQITTASDSKIKRPERALERQAFDDFMDRNPMAGGGMLVQPSADGSRPGYAEDNKKYITPAKRKGADDFPGQKFISVKDESYSDGRKRVKTPEYEAWLKNEQEKYKKNPDRGKHLTNIRREPGLIRIAEAMRFADINDDAEYMMPNKKAMKAQEKYFNRKMKVFKKGMLEAGDIVYINNLERNIDDVIFIADQLGESPDWVLDMLDERTNFRDFSKGEKDVLKQSPEYKKPRNDYLKVENWVQKNAKKYSKPENFEKALIKRFGKDNQFVKDMNSSSKQIRAYFSDDFKKLMLNTEPKSYNTGSQLKQFIKSSLYNFNPKIKNAVTAEIKNIFNSENLPKLRTEARKLLNNNKLLSTFGLNKAITGPYARIIQAEIGQQLWNDITNFRQHRVGTQEMLKAFEQIVSDEFKPMFAEAAKAIGYSKNNQWAKAKEILGLADNIAWDHKVPSSVIDKGYADIIEYTKVNPTTENFNLRIKNAQFDRPINKLITKFEKATTLDAKAKIKNQMDVIKNNFSQKYGGYLDDVSINLDSQGNLKFSSSANPLKMTDDAVAMLGKSMTQAGEINKNQLETLLASFGDDNCSVTFGPKKRDGGRIGYQVGTIDKKRCIDQGIKNINEGKFKTADQVKDATKLLKAGRTVASIGNGLMKYGILPELAFVGVETAGRSILGEKPFNAFLKSIDTLTSIVPPLATDFTSGIEAEKFGRDADRKLAVDKFRESQNKVNSIEQDIANLETLNTGSEFGYEGDQTEAIQMKKLELEAAKKELEKNYVNPDIVQYIDRKGENIADAERANSTDAKLRFKNQMEGMPGVADYMDTETARVFPKQPSQTELNLKLLPNFREALKTKQAKIDRTILNAPDDVLQEIAPEALELKKVLQEAYKMENLKNQFGAEQIYGASGTFFGQPLAGGGIAKLAGIDEGPQRTSMNPDSQGLSGLLKNGMKI